MKEYKDEEKIIDLLNNLKEKGLHYKLYIQKDDKYFFSLQALMLVYNFCFIERTMSAKIKNNCNDDLLSKYLHTTSTKTKERFFIDVQTIFDVKQFEIALKRVRCKDSKRKLAYKNIIL